MYQTQSELKKKHNLKQNPKGQTQRSSSYNRTRRKEVNSVGHNLDRVSATTLGMQIPGFSSAAWGDTSSSW